MPQIDKIITCAWVLQGETFALLPDYGVAIQDDNVVDILPNDGLKARYPDAPVIAREDHLLIPGFINSHCHTPMNLLRGYADDLPLMTWLEDHIWPAENQLLSPEFVALGSELAMAEMIRCGTTCFNDMYFFSEVTAKLLLEVGLRGTLGLFVMTHASPWAQNEAEYFEKAEEICDAFQRERLLRFTIAPHAPYSVSEASLLRAKDFSDARGLPLHIHLHETAEEVAQHVAQTGKRPLATLAELGLLSERFIGVHMTQCTDEDVSLLADTRAHVVHCPESNMKLASGYCPVQQLLNAGVNVALGTDGAASNNDLNMLGECRTGALLEKLHRGEADAIPAPTALKMATHNGAKALGLDAITGSIEVGKAADLVTVDLNCLETLPIHNVLSQLLYAGGREQITDVFVAGRALMLKRKLQTIDEEVLKDRVLAWQREHVSEPCLRHFVANSHDNS